MEHITTERLFNYLISFKKRQLGNSELMNEVYIELMRRTIFDKAKGEN